MNTLIRAAMKVVLAAFALIVVASPAAQAQSWHTFDTDNISRSTAGGKAYTNGSFSWQNLVDEGFNYQEDYRATFSTSLVVNGPKNACAWLRILTYKEDTGLEKRFPAAGTTTFGYYAMCAADGSGSRTISGADEIWNSSDDRSFTRADIRVCYSTGSNVPPSGCYAFSIHPGD